MDRETIAGLLRKVLNETETDSVVAAYLFGSVARQQHTGRSDVDVAVLFDPPPPSRLIGPVSRLHGELEDALLRDVDLVVLNDASPDLVHRVLRDGILLVDRDPKRRIAFEVQARNEYFDIKPYLDAYRTGQAS